MRRVLGIALCAPLLALAQQEPLGWSGRATLSATYARGNAESDRLYADGRATRRVEDSRFGASAKLERRTQPGVDDARSWLGGVNYDRFLSKDRFAYVRGSLEHDSAKDIDRRAALGGGLGADLFDTAAFSLSVRGGPEYVVTERFVAPDERYPALGWGVKATYRFGPARAELFHEQEGFWNLEDTGRVVLRSKSGLRVPLVARLSATAQVNLDWERRPPAGRRPTDTTLLVGLDFAF